MSDISIPLLIVTDSIDSKRLEMPELITNKVDTITSMTCFFVVSVSNRAYIATKVELDEIYIRNHNTAIDHMTKKNDYQLYLWNIAEDQLLKWFYVQPYDRLEKRLKDEIDNSYIHSTRMRYMIHVKLIPAAT